MELRFADKSTQIKAHRIFHDLVNFAYNTITILPVNFLNLKNFSEKTLSDQARNLILLLWHLRVEEFKVA